MAWRPTQYLIEGELDNTEPGKVTGWMQFAGMNRKARFDLTGNFHRDIRGAKVHLTGPGRMDDPEAPSYMDGFAEHQTGKAGDITAGLPPADYTDTPYIEIYGDKNGRIVLEPEPTQVKVIGRPIPACESDPISRAEQQRNMATFLTGVSQQSGVPAIAIGPQPTIVSDPRFTHWVVADEQIVGEARDVEPNQNGTCFAYVRLFSMPECAEYGRIEKQYLRSKAAGLASANEGAEGETP